MAALLIIVGIFGFNVIMDEEPVGYVNTMCKAHIDEHFSYGYWVNGTPTDEGEVTINIHGEDWVCKVENGGLELTAVR